MPIPIAGIAGIVLRGIAGRAFGKSGSAPNPRDLVPKFTFKLSAGGRGIRKGARRIKRNTDRSVRRAVNAAGKETRIEVVAAMSKLAGVPETVIRRRTKARAARPGAGPFVYTVRWAGTIPIGRLKSATFKPYKGRRGRSQGARVGRLTFRGLSGDPITFGGVIAKGRGRARRFLFAETRGRPERGIRGQGFRLGRTPELERIKARTPARFRKALRRELARAARR